MLTLRGCHLNVWKVSVLFTYLERFICIEIMLRDWLIQEKWFPCLRKLSAASKEKNCWQDAHGAHSHVHLNTVRRRDDTGVQLWPALAEQVLGQVCVCVSHWKGWQWNVSAFSFSTVCECALTFTTAVCGLQSIFPSGLAVFSVLMCLWCRDLLTLN